MGLAKFFILWKSLCMMKPKEGLLKAFALFLLLLLLLLGESCLSFHVLLTSRASRVGEATATARRWFDVCWFTWRDLYRFSLSVCICIYVCKYVKFMFVCAKLFFSMYVQNVGSPCSISFWFLALLYITPLFWSATEAAASVDIDVVFFVNLFSEGFWRSRQWHYTHWLTFHLCMYVCVCARFYCKKLENLLNSLCAISGRLRFLLSICAQYEHVNTQLNFFCSGKWATNSEMNVMFER